MRRGTDHDRLVPPGRRFPLSARAVVVEPNRPSSACRGGWTRRPPRRRSGRRSSSPRPPRSTGIDRCWRRRRRSRPLGRPRPRWTGRVDRGLACRGILSEKQPISSGLFEFVLRGGPSAAGSPKVVQNRISVEPSDSRSLSGEYRGCEVRSRNSWRSPTWRYRFTHVDQETRTSCGRGSNPSQSKRLGLVVPALSRPHGWPTPTRICLHGRC